jgi:ABC-type antimicrobial peptide transport system permease subunit
MDGSGMMIVVGVVADVREYGLDRAPSPEIYMPYLQHPGRGSSMFTLVRTHSDPMRLADSVRTEFQRLDPNVPVTFTTLEESLGQTLAAPRFRTVLLGSFALVALVLSVVGLYAVLSYMVSHRTRELALRMALGARPGDVLWMIMAQGLALLVPGVMIGVAVAFAASGLISSVLYSVRVADSRTLIAVPVLMLTVALAALYRPARSAAKVDPAIALRRE